MTDEKNRHAAKPDQRLTGEDAFALTDIYPDAAALFEHRPATIGEIAASSFVTLDANVLLWPYEFNSASLAEVDRVYGQLSKAGRLVVPAQAAREFYKHRSRKLAGLHENINGAIERANKAIFQNTIPILQDDADYKTARDIAAKMVTSGKEIVKRLDAVKARLQSDVGSDPVSGIYRKHLSGSVIEADIEKPDRDSVVQDAERRTRLRIAPGYKDHSKEDGGLGDLIIWKTILQEATRRKGHCLFVTNEEKNDWWVKSGGAFQPRPELLDEYRRASDGGSLHLLPLSELLSLFAAKPEIVQNVLKLEEASRQRETTAAANESFGRWQQRRPASYIVERLEMLTVNRNDFADKLGDLTRDIEKIEQNSGSAQPLSLKREAAFTRDRLIRNRQAVISELEVIAAEIAANEAELSTYLDDPLLDPQTRNWIAYRTHRRRPTA